MYDTVLKVQYKATESTRIAMEAEASTLYSAGRHLSWNSKQPPGTAWKQGPSVAVSYAAIQSDVDAAKSSMNKCKSALEMSENLLKTGLGFLHGLIGEGVSKVRNGKQPFSDSHISKEKLDELAVGLQPNKLMGAIVDSTLKRVVAGNTLLKHDKTLMNFMVAFVHQSPAAVRSFRSMLPGIFPSESAVSNHLNENPLKPGLVQENLLRIIEVRMLCLILKTRSFKP